MDKPSARITERKVDTRKSDVSKHRYVRTSDIIEAKQFRVDEFVNHPDLYPSVRAKFFINGQHGEQELKDKDYIIRLFGQKEQMLSRGVFEETYKKVSD
jgi:hypothetical protein